MTCLLLFAVSSAALLLLVASVGAQSFVKVTGAPGSTYAFFRDANKHFLEWKRHCENLGAEIISLESKEEMDAIAKHVKKNYSGVQFWYTNANERFGSFTWGRGVNADLKESLMWCKGEPNEALDEGCALLKTETMCLQDWSCNKPVAVICERNPNKDFPGCKCEKNK